MITATLLLPTKASIWNLTSQRCGAKAKSVMSTFRGSDQFVEFHLDCFGVSILGVLNEKDHQEGDDRSASIYNQLPRVAKVKDRTRDDPNDDDTNS